MSQHLLEEGANKGGGRGTCSLKMRGGARGGAAYRTWFAPQSTGSDLCSLASLLCGPGRWLAVSEPHSIPCERGVMTVPTSQAVGTLKSVSAAARMRTVPARSLVLSAGQHDGGHEGLGCPKPTRASPGAVCWKSAVGLLLAPLGLGL